MENSDWIEWKGGECPVPWAARVDVKFRDGAILTDTNAELWALGRSWWEHASADPACDIIAYRIVEDRHDD